MKKFVIALVGMPGAGKSTCVAHLTNRGWPSVYFGGVVVEEVKRRFGKVTEKREKVVREELRAKEGMGAIAKRIIPQIDALLRTHNVVVADGLYSWTEYKILQEHFDDGVLVVVAITAPRKARHRWLSQRSSRPLTEDEAIAREYAEIENSEKGGPIANADYTVVNDGTPEEMTAKLDKILKQLDII